MKHSEPVDEIRWSLTRENSSKTQIFLTRINILTVVDQYGNLRPGPAKDVHYHTHVVADLQGGGISTQDVAYLQGRTNSVKHSLRKFAKFVKK